MNHNNYGNKANQVFICASKLTSAIYRKDRRDQLIIKNNLVLRTTDVGDPDVASVAFCMGDSDTARCVLLGGGLHVLLVASLSAHQVGLR